MLLLARAKLVVIVVSIVDIDRVSYHSTAVIVSEPSLKVASIRETMSLICTSFRIEARVVVVLGVLVILSWLRVIQLVQTHPLLDICTIVLRGSSRFENKAPKIRITFTEQIASQWKSHDRAMAETRDNNTVIVVACLVSHYHALCEA